ncbi:hypothetical protein D3C86_1754790 [compost metagenome]
MELLIGRFADLKAVKFIVKILQAGVLLYGELYAFFTVPFPANVVEVFLVRFFLVFILYCLVHAVHPVMANII